MHAEGSTTIYASIYYYIYAKYARDITSDWVGEISSSYHVT